MTSARVAALASTLSLIVVGGTVFFRFVERWAWLDSLFFTVVTLSTVGYGNFVPETALGKIGTMVLIFAGLGVFAATIQQVTMLSIRTREDRIRRARQSDDNATDRPKTTEPAKDVE